MTLNANAITLNMPRVLVAWIAAAVIFAAPVRAAQTYENPQAHFSLSLPDGWKNTTASETLDASAEKNNGKFVAVYRLNVEMPELIVQVSAGRLRLDALAGRMQTAFDDKVKESGEAFPGKFVVTIDQAHNRVIATLTPDVIGAGAYRVIHYAYPGEEDTIQLTFYDYPNQFTDDAAQFQQIADSFKFEPGHGYPDYAALAKSDVRLTVGLAIATVLIAAALILIVHSVNKANQRKALERMEQSRLAASSAPPTSLFAPTRPLVDTEIAEESASSEDDSESSSGEP